MKKLIDEKRSRIIYTGNVFELKEYLQCLANEIPLNKKDILKSAGNLENITDADYLNNNIHTFNEKLYFSGEKILYSSRDDWFFPIVKENAKKADEWFLTLNPEYNVDKRTIGYYYLLKNFGKKLITKLSKKLNLF